MPIYGIIITRGENEYNVISTNKKKLDAFAARERKKGFLVRPFYKAYITMRIHGGTGVIEGFNLG